MSEEVQEEIAAQGPGTILKDRRESLQLSIEDIAGKLHLRPAVVADLESDIIDHSVSITFTKGYVRLYAKHMGMDPAPVLAAFDELANPIKQPAKLQSFSQRVAKQASDTRLMILSYSILLVIIAMAVIWWFQQPEEPESASENLTITSNDDAQPVPGEPELMAVTEPVLTAQSSNTDSNGFDSESTQVQNTVNSVNTQRTSVNEDSASAIETGITESSQAAELAVTDPTFADDDSKMNDTEQALPPEEIETQFDPAQSTIADSIVDTVDGSFVEAADNSVATNQPVNTDFSESFGNAEPITQELVFTFAEDCWMNLTDATGENIAYGVKNAGRVMPVSGIPPFEVVLGAPQAVSITVDGKPFDMSAFPAGRTARFTIGTDSENTESPVARELTQ